MSNKSYRYMELNGFIGEERINEFYFSHQITDLQYVKHHSQEMLDAYNSYLQDHGLKTAKSLPPNTWMKMIVLLCWKWKGRMKWKKRLLLLFLKVR